MAQWHPANRTTPVIILISFVAIVFLTTCSADQEINKAAKAVEYARSVHADYLSPYEFTSAEIYLGEARNQSQKSDYERAAKYAIKAADFAARASTMAIKNTPVIAVDPEKSR